MSRRMLPGPTEGSWKNDLEQAVRRCKGQVIGWRKIEFAQHGLLVRTAILAYVDDPWVTFYIEELPPESNIPRPDLILIHPEIGVMVIENKGNPTVADGPRFGHWGGNQENGAMNSDPGRTQMRGTSIGLHQAGPARICVISRYQGVYFLVTRFQESRAASLASSQASLEAPLALCQSRLMVASACSKDLP